MKTEGITYRPPCAVHIGVENDNPQFGRLDEIFVITTRILLNVTVLETVTFNEHLQAYTIIPTSNTKVILHSQLLTPFPFHTYYRRKRVTCTNCL